MNAKAGDGNKTWKVKYENPKEFIENKGQFLINETTENNSKVLYAVDNGATKIYFTAKGITYFFVNKSKKEDKEDEREELRKGKSHIEIEKEEHQMSIETDAVDMIWDGANRNVQLIAEDLAPDYHNYPIAKENGKPQRINHIHGYKKLTYKNLYPNIDIEYSFHPESGLKYKLILHPGADISLVKMKFNKGVKINATGDVLVDTKFGDIVDHAPVTFYSENKSSVIPSQFIKKGKTVSFSLVTPDNTKTIVIDPWVQTPSLSSSNGVWECEKDAAGNIYIIGGDSPLTLQQYNSAGVLQWTYPTAWSIANDWLGTLATDLAGNSYVTDGSTAAMEKVDNAANSVWSVTGGSMDEYWSIAFNCDQTKMIVGGTRLVGLPSPTGDGMIFDINTSNGSINATKVVGYDRPGLFGINDIEEVRAITSSYNARYYFMTLDSIGSFDQNFSACASTGNTLFDINSTYHFAYKMENYRPSNGNSGICALKANKNFLYSQNGTTIQQRSLTTGAVIATATIPGGVSVATTGQNQAGNSGIDIDSCGNVYVGSSGAVIKYDANLVQLASVAVPFNVYDVVVTYGGNIVVTGTDLDNSASIRTGYVQQINMGSCLPNRLICCDATVCSIPPLCTSNADVTLSPVTPGGTWSGTGVSAAGVFSPSAVGAGVFTLTYTLACGSSTIDMIVNSCTPLTVCIHPDSSLSVSGGTGPYNWQHQIVTQNCSACLFGCTLPPGCAVNVNSWSTYLTGVTIPKPDSLPVQVIDNAGTIYTVTNYSSLPACSNCPTITTNITAQVNINCYGQTNGSFNATTSGGASPYNYNLMNGGTTVSTFNNVTGTQSFTGLSANVYTLNTTDANACAGTTTVNITQPAALAITPTSSNVNCYGGNNGSATATVSGGTTPYIYTWTGGGSTSSLNGLHAGTYIISVVDGNGCIKKDTIIITQPGNLNDTLKIITTFCQGDARITLHIQPGIGTYNWYAGTDTTGIVLSTADSLVVISPTVGSVYTVIIHTGGSSCPYIITNTLNYSPPPNLPDYIVKSNVFTPDGDGKNDKFDLNQFANVKDFHIEIFNRWGKKVFESSDLSNQWDGKINGNPADEGVYYWMATYTSLCTPNGESVQNTGFVQVLMKN